MERGGSSIGSGNALKFQTGRARTCDFSLLTDWVRGRYLERMHVIVFQWSEGDPMQDGGLKRSVFLVNLGTCRGDLCVCVRPVEHWVID